MYFKKNQVDIPAILKAFSHRMSALLVDVSNNVNVAITALPALPAHPPCSSRPPAHCPSPPTVLSRPQSSAFLTLRRHPVD
jgi:hypothetical protein